MFYLKTDHFLHPLLVKIKIRFEKKIYDHFQDDYYF